MHHPYRTIILAAGLLALGPDPAGADFRGRPVLLGAEGGGSRAAWVAYDNGEVLRCRADTGGCQAMSDLPTFASPVSLSVEPDHAAAWIGWSDGSLYRCSAAGRCAPINPPTAATPPRP